MCCLGETPAVRLTFPSLAPILSVKNNASVTNRPTELIVNKLHSRERDRYRNRTGLTPTASFVVGETDNAALSHRYHPFPCAGSTEQDGSLGSSHRHGGSIQRRKSHGRAGMRAGARKCQHAKHDLEPSSEVSHRFAMPSCQRTPSPAIASGVKREAGKREGSLRKNDSFSLWNPVINVEPPTRS